MPLEMKYFVLKPKSKYYGDPYAKASRMAMQVYASWITKEDCAFAKKIADWAREEELNDIKLGGENVKGSSV